MHKIFVLGLLCVNISCNQSTTPPADTTENANNKLNVDIINNPRTPDNSNLGELGVLQFADSLHDFGNVKEGDIVSYDFEYKNTGKAPVIITEARASCGCTVPEYTKDPILPGATGKMQVTFNSDGKPGANYKNVTIKSNANPGSQDIAIKAMVN